MELRANLDFFDELRETSRLRVMALKQRCNLAHNTQIQPKTITVGGLVLLKSELTGRNQGHDTLQTAWSGPYTVVSQPRRGVYRVKDCTGKHHKHKYHVDDLKPCYV